jgi:hypothetical protein
MSSSSSTMSGIGSSITNRFKSIDPCNRTIGLFYLYVLILVLILTGNIIQQGKKDKSLGWLSYSICVILGIIGMILIWLGSHPRTYVVPIINLLIAGLLMYAMITVDSSSAMTEKIGAHFANICFLLVTIFGLYMSSDSEIANACSKQQQQQQ